MQQGTQETLVNSKTLASWEGGVGKEEWKTETLVKITQCIISTNLTKMMMRQ